MQFSPLTFSSFIACPPVNYAPFYNSAATNREPSAPNNAEGLDVSAKYKRLEGLVDVIKLIGGALLMVIEKVIAAVSSLFNRGNPKLSEISQNAETDAQNLARDIGKDFDTICTYAPYINLGDAGESTPNANSMFMLRACYQAYNKMQHGRILDSALEQILKIISDGSAALSTPKKILKTFENYIPEKNLGAFRSNVNIERGLIAPKVLTREFKVEGADTLFLEETKNLDTSFGAKFLSLYSGEFEDQIEYIDSHQLGRGIRISEVRREPQAQGMTINAREHTLQWGENRESIFRSGAFAVHDPYYPTESDFGAYLDYRTKESVTKKLAKRWGMRADSITADIIYQRIAKRRKLCIAQALPKIIASVRKMAADSILPSDGFLHVEQSLLSDQYSQDKEMIRDMHEAIRFIRTNIKVQFISDGEETIKDAGRNKYVLKLRNRERASDRAYPIKALFFTQGVNEMQSIGHAFKSGRNTLQDGINLQNLMLLFQYAANNSKSNYEAIDALRRHYSPDNVRNGKDVKSLMLIAEAVKALNGRRGVVCKSAKDRTAAEINDGLARAASEGNASLQRRIRDNLSGGISLKINEQCTDKEKYAFATLQYCTLPSNWKPPLRYCGNSQS